jgi:pimeloyl-ACP methyl ester carboxylesterase
VHEVFNLLEIRKAVIVGHSLGGMIGVLLLKPLSEILSGFVNMEGNLVLSDCGASLEVAGAEFLDFQARLYSSLKQEVLQDCPKRALWLDDIPDYVFYASSQSIVEWSKSEKLLALFGESQCCSLYVYGDRNKEKLLTVPNHISTCQINNSGHFMLLDNPNSTYACLEGFLASALLSQESPRTPGKS